MQYICSPCGFKTSAKGDYGRHIESNKHKKNIAVQEKQKNNTVLAPTQIPDLNKIYKCQYCGIDFSNSSSLSRHKKICIEKTLQLKEIEMLRQWIAEKDKQLESKNKEIENKDKQLENKDIQLINKDKQLENKDKQIDIQDRYMYSITKLNSPKRKKIMNYFGFLCTNYPNTPALGGQESHSGMIKAKTMKFIDVISMYYYDKRLVSFIGEYIIKLYKKEEPKDQSMWSTDVSRLTYIISESCKLGGNTWAYDKRGVKIKKIVIDPALKYISDELHVFLEKNRSSDKQNIMKQMMAATDIILSINDGTLSNNISKYIAPEFHLSYGDKNGELGKQIESVKNNIKKIEALKIPNKDKEEMYDSDDSNCIESTDDYSDSIDNYSSIGNDNSEGCSSDINSKLSIVSIKSNGIIKKSPEIHSNPKKPQSNSKPKKNANLQNKTKENNIKPIKTNKAKIKKHIQISPKLTEKEKKILSKYIIEVDDNKDDSTEELL